MPDGSDDPVDTVVESIEASIGHLGIDAEVDVRHDTSTVPATELNRSPGPFRRCRDSASSRDDGVAPT